MLLLNLSDTAATSQDGLSLEFIAAIAGRQCYIQNAIGRGLCLPGRTILKVYLLEIENVCIITEVGIYREI